jgi:hypothetical protein
MTTTMTTLLDAAADIDMSLATFVDRDDLADFGMHLISPVGPSLLSLSGVRQL